MPWDLRGLRGSRAAVLLFSERKWPSAKHYAKGSLYARAGIQDYWIVNIIDRCVEVYRDPGHESYRTCQRFFVGDSLAPLAAPEAMISVAEIFRRE
jgi:Uma2 family endonuclease